MPDLPNPQDAARTAREPGSVAPPTPDDLRALADLAGPERAVLSVYLSGPGAYDTLDEHLGSARAFLKEEPDETEHLEANWAALEPLLQELKEEGSAVCGFACFALDAVAAFAIPYDVEDRVWVGPSPYLRPLAEGLDEFEPFAVVVADNKGADLYHVLADSAEQARRVSGDVKNSVKKGGWSQKRYARRREKELEVYAGEVVEALKTLDDTEGFSRLVLLGQPEAMQAIRERLPTSLQERLVGEEAVDVSDSAQAALTEAFRLAFEGERAEERQLWDRIKEQGLRGGLAVAGPARVLEALKAARVDAVLLDREAEFDGTQCRACDALVYGTPDTCQTCGSSDVFDVDLVNEIVELATQTGADVDFSDPLEGLKEAGQIAAFLRY